MDTNILQYLINLSVVIPFFIVLIVVSVKLSKGTLDNAEKDKFVQIIERTNLSKDTNMYVIKTGNKGCVVLVSSSHTEKIKDLSQEEIKELINNKVQRKCNGINKIKSKSFGLNYGSINNGSKENKLWKY